MTTMVLVMVSVSAGGGSERAGGQAGWMTLERERERGGDGMERGPRGRIVKGLREKEFRQVWDRTGG